MYSSKSVTYFGSFGVEHIPKEIKTFIDNNNITRNIFIIQAYNSVMCGYVCIELIHFMLKGKSFTNFINFFHQILNYVVTNV